MLDQAPGRIPFPPPRKISISLHGGGNSVVTPNVFLKMCDFGFIRQSWEKGDLQPNRGVRETPVGYLEETEEWSIGERKEVIGWVIGGRAQTEEKKRE